MTHWFDVFRYELRQQFRRKAYLFITFGVPVLALVVFFGYQAIKNMGDEDDTPPTPVTEVNEGGRAIGYVDMTPEQLFPAPESYPNVSCAPSATELEVLGFNSALNHTRRAVIKRISSPYCLHGLVTRYDTRSAGEAAVTEGKITALYVIEPDYVETGSVSIYIKGLDLQIAETRTLMQDFLLRSVLFDVAPDAYETLYLRLRDPAFVIEHRLLASGATEQSHEGQNFVLVYGFGLMLMISIFWGGGYLMQSVVQEKETRVIEIVLSSVRPLALLLGKVLAMGLLSLLQISMIAGAFIVIASQAGNVFEALGDIDVSPAMLVVLALYFVLGFLFFGSLMAAIGAMTTSVRESQNFVTFITLPAMVPFFFLSIFAEEPNSTLAVVLSLIPMTAPLSMVMRVAITDVPIVQLALGITLQVVSIAAAIWLAGRLFRVNTLLMGNTPKLKDIPKLIRG